MGPFIRRAIESLARFIRFALQLLAQLLETRLHFEEFLLRGFGASLKLLYITWFEIRPLHPRIVVGLRIVVQLNTTSVRYPDLRLINLPAFMISAEKISSHGTPTLDRFPL